MDVLLPVFQLLYFIVHFLFSLAQAVYDCFFELYHLFTNIVWVKKWMEPSEKKIQQDISLLKKIPRHLGFIFMPKQTSHFKYISQVLKWCKSCGINTISLYDIDGTLKSKLPHLLSHLSLTCKDITFKINDEVSMFSQNRTVGTQQNYNGKSLLRKTELCSKDSLTGNSPQDCDTAFVTLNVLSITNGKRDLANINTKFCETKLARFETNCVQNELVTKGQVDPDFVIVLGRPTCTLGFLPWQIRLTEFVEIPSLSRLSYSEFKKQLFIFSKCQQNFGS